MQVKGVRCLRVLILERLPHLPQGQGRRGLEKLRLEIDCHIAPRQQLLKNMQHTGAFLTTYCGHLRLIGKGLKPRVSVNNPSNLQVLHRALRAHLRQSESLDQVEQYLSQVITFAH